MIYVIENAVKIKTVLYYTAHIGILTVYLHGNI